jgi:prepilin-type N-terminal cleavage/methylation domain-containing protein
MHTLSLVRPRAQHGFGMIELMVTVSILGLLAATSVMTLGAFKQQAYSATAAMMVHDARNALEAGREEKLGHSDFFWALSSGNGTLIGFRTDEFVPGIRPANDTYLYVSYDSVCDSAATDAWCPLGVPCCIVEETVASHCKARTAKARMRWNNGLEVELDVPPVGC